MSNLGGYQLVTTFIKSVGGPKAALKLTATAGGLMFFAGGAAYAGIQKVRPALTAKASQLFKKWQSQAGRIDELAGEKFTVKAPPKKDNVAPLNVGDIFRVLERDADVVLIELIGNENNPWVVSAELLSEISDFPSASLTHGADASGNEEKSLS